MKERAAVSLAPALAMAVLFASQPAHAQATYNSAPIGGRSALMGGTGIALGRDGAGPFLNPASIVHIDDTGVAFSVNFYSYQSAHFSGFHQPGPVSASQYGPLSLPNPSLDSSRVDALPSTLCFFFAVGGSTPDAPAKGTSDEVGMPVHRKGRKKIAACVTSPERLQVSATADGYAGTSAGLHATQTTSLAQFWNRLYVGPSYGVYTSDDVALGASLQGIGTVANSTWAVDTLVTDDTGHGSASSYATGTSAYSVDVGAILGLLWHVGPRETIGLSLMTPSVHLFGQYQGTTSQQSQDGAGAASAATTTVSKGSYRATTPMRLGVGFGADRGRMHVEGDATAYIPVTDLAHAEVQSGRTALAGGVASTSSFAQTLTVAGRPVVDAAVGMEWFLSPGFSLLGGANTDFSAIAPLAPSPPIGTLVEARNHHAGLSLGLGSYGDGSELLFGTQLAFGWGKSIAVDPYVSPTQLALVDQRTFGAMLVIAGSVSLSAFKRTLQDLQTVVKIRR
jgi:hypothetical protein